MRRLVVISNKSKAIAASVAAVLSLTSIHLAAAARIASLRREQEQLEERLVSTRPSTLGQEISSPAIQAEKQRLGSEEAISERKIGGASIEKADLSANLAVPEGDNAIPPAHKRQVVISITDRQLAVMDDGQVLKIYPIAVGTRGTPSPNGDFVIINHAKNPTYRHGNKEIAPGKDNPLGSRWMGLNLKGYGIHGTNVQSSVGKESSHGCFRMRKSDVEELYDLVRVGDAVMIRRDRDAMIAQVFATSGTTQTANVLAARAQNNGDVHLASAGATATVETTQ
jgi:lipoprotein-anchoring transpeptidase ErfK/SrfK